jgi:hypothetical protein
MKRTVFFSLVALAGLAGCAASPTTAKPLPQAQAGAVETTITTEPAAVEQEEVASSCDIAREALLTGTQSDIDAAMAGLMADKAADATAREYADYYLHRDAGEPQMREMDVSLIRMSCS